MFQFKISQFERGLRHAKLPRFKHETGWEVFPEGACGLKRGNSKQDEESCPHSQERAKEIDEIARRSLEKDKLTPTILEGSIYHDEQWKKERKGGSANRLWRRS